MSSILLGYWLSQFAVERSRESNRGQLLSWIVVLSRKMLRLPLLPVAWCWSGLCKLGDMMNDAQVMESL